MGWRQRRCQTDIIMKTWQACTDCRVETGERERACLAAPPRPHRREERGELEMISASCHQQPVQILPPPPPPPPPLTPGTLQTLLATLLEGMMGKSVWTRYCNCEDFILETTHVVLSVFNILWSVADMNVVQHCHHIPTVPSQVPSFTIQNSLHIIAGD